MIAASVIICTHNRAGILGRAVEQVLRQAPACNAEVLVVDNASTDDTRAVLAAARGEGAPPRVVREPTLGLSAARNRGLAEARGEIAVFLDDDAVPRAGWLAALLAPFAASSVACAGGRIDIHFAYEPPAWFCRELSGALSAFDLGSEPRRLRYGRPGDYYPHGANIAFRIADAKAAGGFSTLVGPVGRRLFVHDETDLCYRIDEAGGEVHYVPAAVVDHWVLPERLTPRWFLRRYWEGGHSAAIFILRNRGVLRAIWRLRWHYGAALVALPYLARDPIVPDRFVRECRRREAWGYVVGLADGIRRFRTLRRDRMSAAGKPRAASAVAAATTGAPDS